jgi:hypothetical protein
MRRSSRATTAGTVLWLTACGVGSAACSTSGHVAPELSRLLADAPSDVPARLWLAGDRIVAAAAPLGPGVMPPAVRTTVDAIAPGGALVFAGREWGPRGDGFRVDKRYAEPDHQRSVLVALDGAVLERAHTVPLPDVPQHVLATALRTGPHVDEAWIVSGPETEEHWTFVVRDRGGRTFAVRVGLAGEPRGRLRRTSARVDS